MNTRNTLQKNIILAGLKKLCHPTAEDVYQTVARDYPTISKATVYRNLNQMAQSGTILKIKIPDGADRFDTTAFEHYHIRCSECGRVYDVDMPYLHGLEDQVRDKHGFEFRGHEIVFVGTCPDCNNQNQMKRGKKTWKI